MTSHSFLCKNLLAKKKETPPVEHRMLGPFCEISYAKNNFGLFSLEQDGQ